jgi:3-oxoacyl-[acyl-carrier-protein] synthase III
MMLLPLREVSLNGEKNNFYTWRYNTMTNLTNTQRIENLEKDFAEVKSDLKTLIAMMQNGQKPTNSQKGQSADKKAEREAKREAEKDAFKATHKLVRSSKENKQLVYAEMKKQGINEFNRKDYERIAKGLGVLGKNGSVVATWEETK